MQRIVLYCIVYKFFNVAYVKTSRSTRNDPLSRCEYLCAIGINLAGILGEAEADPEDSVGMEQLGSSGMGLAN